VEVRLIRVAISPAFKTAGAIAIGLALLCACSSGSNGANSGALPGAAEHVQPLKSSDFKRVAAWGPKGKPAVAQCPQGEKVIAGGSSSNDGSFVGTGYASSSRNAWIVKPNAGASAEAFATCVARGGIGPRFQWRSGYPLSGIASAQCREGYVLVTGYGTGTVTASWFNPDTKTYWVSGGGSAYASCARSDTGVFIRHAWNQSQKPKSVFAGCGSGFAVIGGAMGNSAWPGPPIQQHPGVPSSPGIHGNRGWWTFSNALNELTWAACVQS
jgi:hypothetical protein